MIKKEMIGVIAGISGEKIVKELKKLGYDTLVIGGRKNDSGMNIAYKSFSIDLKNKEIILNVLKENNVKKLIVGTGHILAFEVAEYLFNNGIKISINPKSSLIAKDKFLYKEELKKYGFKTPNYLLLKKDSLLTVEEIIKKIKIPCVVKSVIDTIYPKKANTIVELKEYINEVKITGSDILIEEYIEGVDITVPVVSNSSNQKALLVSYYSKAKECKLKGFENFQNNKKLSFEIEKEILKLSEEVISKTKIIGLARLDIIVNDKLEFYILECNSVMVTGVHPNQLEYGQYFLEKEKINFAEIMVKNALDIFNLRIK